MLIVSQVSVGGVLCHVTPWPKLICLFWMNILMGKNFVLQKWKLIKEFHVFFVMKKYNLGICLDIVKPNIGKLFTCFKALCIILLQCSGLRYCGFCITWHSIKELTEGKCPVFNRLLGKGSIYICIGWLVKNILYVHRSFLSCSAEIYQKR